MISRAVKAEDVQPITSSGQNLPVVGDGSVRDTALCFDLQAIHLPDIDLPIVVAPENVTVAVAVLRADALDVPIAGDGSVRDRALRFDVQAVHLPNVDLPAVVAP